MRVLVATLFRRAHGRVYQYPAATESILALQWPTQLDYFMPSGGDTSADSIWRKYEEARRAALVGGYDALLCAESDMLLPVDALEKLAAVGTDITYGLYCFRRPPYQWNITTRLDRFSYRFLSDDPDSAAKAWGRVIQCEGVGQGCTLINRKVLETLPFRYAPDALVDHLIALDAKTYGFKQAVDMSVICGHMVEGGGAVWPVNEGTLWHIQH